MMQSLESQSDLQYASDILAKLDGMTKGQWRCVFILSMLQLYVPVHTMNYAFVSKEIPFSCDEIFDNNSATPAAYCDSCSNKTFPPTESSIVSEFDLTCERAWLSPLTMSWFMFGAVIGTLILGWASDAKGRKFILFLTLFFMISANVLGAAMNGFDVHCISRVISGFFCGGYLLSISVLTNEIVSNKDRGMASLVTTNAKSLGVVLLSILAYFNPHWRFFTMTTSLVGIPVLLMLFTLPESPIWLQDKGRIEEATKSLQVILNGNGSKFQLQTVKKMEESSESGRICDLFSTCSSSTMTFIVMYCWFVNHAAYYGLFLVAGSESSNLYISGALNGMIEVPSNILGPVLMSHFGRKTSFSGFFLMAGILLFVIPIFGPTQPVLKMLIASSGFFWIAASIDIGHIFTNELFPTYIRNTGMGIVGVSARFGGIAAPYIAKFGQIYPNLHFIVFGSLALSAGIASLALPETAGQKLPETMADLLKMLKNRNKSKKDEECNLLPEE